MLLMLLFARSDIKIIPSYNCQALINTPAAQVNPRANKHTPCSLSLPLAFIPANYLLSSDVHGVVGRAPTWHTGCLARPAVLMRSNRYTQFPKQPCPRHSSAATMLPGDMSTCCGRPVLLRFSKVSRRLGPQHVRVHVLAV